MSLSAETNIARYLDQELRTFPVKASTTIYRGGIVGIDRVSGCIRPLTSTDKPAGVAYESCDNSSGSNADKSARVFTRGDFEMTITGVAVTDIGRLALASADDTVALSGSGMPIGTIIGVPSTNTAIVRFDADTCAHLQQTSIALPCATDGAGSLPIMNTIKAIQVYSVQVGLATAPGGTPALDVGFHATDPDELVDAYNLGSMSDNSIVSLPLVTTTIAAGKRLWAKVGQATTTAADGGVLTITYALLP